MFTTGCVMSAATAFRTGRGCLELCSERGASLVRLGLESQQAAENAARARGQFRDELIAMARDCTEIAVRELRRGVEDLDAFTRPEEPQAGRPRRPYKAKR
jgi:hypothetical protein